MKFRNVQKSLDAMFKLKKFFYLDEAIRWDVRSVEEQNEYYGPIDGVCPVDHPDTYYILMR